MPNPMEVTVPGIAGAAPDAHKKTTHITFRPEIALGSVITSLVVMLSGASAFGGFTVVMSHVQRDLTDHKGRIERLENRAPDWVTREKFDTLDSKLNAILVQLGEQRIQIKNVDERALQLYGEVRQLNELNRNRGGK